MIFLTVGTSFPFDRLVRAVDEAVAKKDIKEKIFAQVGKGGYRPKNFNSIEILDKIKFDEYFSRSSAIIAHAGMGTITMALEENKPILVMPRLKKFQELVNNHQLFTARRFEQLGHVLAVYEKKDLPYKLDGLKSFQPVQRRSQAKDVAERIGRFISELPQTVQIAIRSKKLQ